MILVLLTDCQWNCVLCKKDSFHESIQEAEQEIEDHLREDHLIDLRFVCRLEKPQKKDGRKRVHFTGPRLKTQQEFKHG